ncbi:MAG: hypothetical protein HRT45_19495, partial [Bdellovibrionales bacterium]|nr:hypothetical protein [Bdellovibrionales bacterium]
MKAKCEIALVMITIISVLLSAPAKAGEVISLLSDLAGLAPIEVQDPDMEMIIDEDDILANGCPNYKNVKVDDNHPIRFGGINRFSQPHVWSLAQWNSQADLYPGHGAYNGHNIYRWDNAFKTFQVGKRGSSARTFTMGVNGEKEYNGRWGAKLDSCFETPHPALLLSQKMDYNNKLIKFGQVKKVMLKMGTRVTKEKLANRHKDYFQKNKSKYTAHFKIHVNISYLRNDKRKDLGHGQSFGLSINYYDVRNQDKNYEKGDINHRSRTGRYMLNVALADLAGKNARKNLHAHKWVNFEVDIMPMIKEAFQNAIVHQQQNQDPLIQKSLGQYVIKSFNIGWEVSR